MPESQPSHPSDQVQPSSQTMFVISPIGSAGTAVHQKALQALQYIVRKAFPEPQWEVVRADEEVSPDSISQQIIGRIIDKSDFIVADLTDHNPNVFYEVAVAHAYRRPVIHMITEGQPIPFDLQDQRVTSYDLANPESVDAAISSLRAAQKWLEDGHDPRTPLTSFSALRAISAGGEGDGEEIAKVLTQIVDRLTRLERRLPPGPFRSSGESYSYMVGEARFKNKVVALRENEAGLSLERESLWSADEGQTNGTRLRQIEIELDELRSQIKGLGGD